MNVSFNEIREDKITFWGFSLSALFIILSICIILFFYHTLPPFLPLFNKMPWGYERVGSKNELFLPFGLMAGFFLINLFISSLIYRKVALLARLVCATTIAVCLSTFMYIVQIILLIK